MHPNGPTRNDPGNDPNNDPGSSPGKDPVRASETLNSHDGPARNDRVLNVVGVRQAVGVQQAVGAALVDVVAQAVGADIP